MPAARRPAIINEQEFATVNNSDLADTIAAAGDVSKAAARKIVDGVFIAIAEAAANGEEISLSGFGKFKVKDSPEREGRNPATGKTMTIKAAKKLSFTAAKGIKDKLNA
jgi:DNA-binding protein HU-beta